jgi:prepilin-type N-terminal cleavage/methylation domain-containing protein
MKTNQKGFTLIELLVVIAIIGLLSTLSIVALNSARARARDARRLSDIQQIQSALEMFYNDANSYPTAVTAGSTIAGSSTYLAIVPKAPTPADNNTGAVCTASSSAYVYATQNGTGGVANGSYTLTYCLGGLTGSVAAGLNTATPAGISLK